VIILVSSLIALTTILRLLARAVTIKNKYWIADEEFADYDSEFVYNSVIDKEENDRYNYLKSELSKYSLLNIQ